MNSEEINEQNKISYDSQHLSLRIKEIIRDNLDSSISTDSIDLNSNLADLGINSITMVKIVIAIETEFDFEFGDEDLGINKFPTVEYLETYVKKRCNKDSVN